MTAIKTTNIVEGNLAQEPKYFPQGQYVALRKGDKNLLADPSRRLFFAVGDCNYRNL